MSAADAAQAQRLQARGISTRTASKWVARYRREGVGRAEDRSSAPHRMPRRTSEDRVAAIAALRRVRMTAAEISELLGMPLSTVSAVLLRIGLGKRSRLEPLEPANRYQRERPASSSTSTSRSSAGSTGVGHRITGNRRQPARPQHAGRQAPRSAGSTSTSASTTPPAWPTSRCSTTRKATPSPAFSAAQSLSTPRYGIHVERVMTDNGAGYRSIRPRPRLPHPRPPPPPHPALPAPHQRQSRTLHPHHARRLGLRRDLRHLQPNEPEPSQAGSTTTIAADHTAASTTSHPSPASRR